MQPKELAVSTVTALFELAVAIGGLAMAVSLGLDAYLYDYRQGDPENENMKGIVVMWIGAGFAGFLGGVALYYFFDTFRDIRTSYLRRVVEKAEGH